MSSNPMHDKGQIFLIAILRGSTVCACYSNGEVEKEGVRELIISNPSAKPGMRYSVTGVNQSVHYFVDMMNRIYCLVVHPKYPVRIVFGIIDELQGNFQKVYGGKLATAGEESLSKSSKQLLKDLIEKYGNPAAADKLVAVQDKIDVVKTQMQENIQQLLLNSEQLERIATSAEQLNEKSVEFRSGTMDLRRKMWWKMLKMRLLIGGIIIALLIVIIVPIVIISKKSK